MLHFPYAEDTARYPDERQRVEQAFLIKIFAYTGLRPNFTTHPARAQRTGHTEQSSDTYKCQSVGTARRHHPTAIMYISLIVTLFVTDGCNSIGLRFYSMIAIPC